MSILKALNLIKTYRIEDREIRVLDQVALSVATGEFMVIAGSSGSGKSTLLSILSGLDKPTSGRVIIEDVDITDMTEDGLASMRNEKIGFVFQSFHLVPSLSAIENVVFPAELKKDPDAWNKGESLLERVGLADRRNNFPSQLSGGEKQRVAICRALINRPAIIFADEPTGNLDSKNSDAILELLVALKTTLVLVTHSRRIAESADRVITLTDGRITGE